jgi:P27 family predicted phage terminase small subunit
MDYSGKPGPKAARRLSDDTDYGHFKPRMPRGLADDAKRLWRVIVPILAENGQLTPLDTAGLEALCQSYAAMSQAAGELARDGVTQIDHRGIRRKHPSFQIWRDGQATFRAWAGEYGLTPLARKSVPAATTKPMTLIDEFNSFAEKT